VKLIVCGGRNYQERAAQFRAMDEIHATTQITLVIHGACTDRGDQEADWRGSLGRRVGDRARGTLHGRAGPVDKGR
jgi:hypothetical protein